MNHLAHLHLAPPTPLARVGGLLGDFARGLDLAGLPAEVALGIAHHRAVDRFTDAHPVFRRSRARLPASLRRHGGILVDVFYDHFLARDWDERGDGRPLAAFTAEIYRQLSTHGTLLPAPLRSALPAMIARDWLAACRDLDGTAIVLQRLQARLRRPVPLAAGILDLRADYRAFADDFAAFYPELAAFAASPAALGQVAAPRRR